MDIQNTKALKYIVCFILMLGICIGLLAASACMPQKAVARNIARSLPGLALEGTYPKLKAGYESTMLDNYTDSLILMQVLGTKASDISTIISNPLFLYKDDPLKSLINYSENPDIEPDGYYVRYWMGFRATLRPLFCFFTVSQIRKIAAVVLFMLVIASLLSVAKRTGIAAALALGISFLLMRPFVIVRSFQYATCFLIAFASLLFIPSVYEKRKNAGIFFMLLGMATQYFDFYTVPALTYCMPALYLFSLYVVNGEAAELKRFFETFLAWSLGYAGMWIAKLTLATCFSEQNGFSNGLAEFSLWMKHDPNETGMVVKALRSVFITLCPNAMSGAVLGGLLAVLAVYAGVRFAGNKYGANFVKNRRCIVLVTLIPLLWYAAASRPTAGHAFFQYRSVAAVLWGVCLIFTSYHGAGRLRKPG